MQVANRLRELRVAYGQTQAQLAVAIAVDPSTIYRWEAGEAGIPDARKVQLATYFAVSVGWLMCWPEEGNGNGGNGVRVAA